MALELHELFRVHRAAPRSEITLRIGWAPNSPSDLGAMRKKQNFGAASVLHRSSAVIPRTSGELPPYCIVL